MSSAYAKWKPLMLLGDGDDCFFRECAADSKELGVVDWGAGKSPLPPFFSLYAWSVVRSSNISEFRAKSVYYVLEDYRDYRGVCLHWLCSLLVLCCEAKFCDQWYMTVWSNGGGPLPVARFGNGGKQKRNRGISSTIFVWEFCKWPQLKVKSKIILCAQLGQSWIPGTEA